MKALCFIFCFLLSTEGSTQIITTIAGKGTFGFSGEGGLAIDAEFNFLAGLTTDRLGNIYLADRYNSVIQKIDTNSVLTRFAGNGSSGESGDGGPATDASLYLGTEVGLAVDSIGNIFIAAEGKVRKVNTAGIISTFAGTGVYGSSGDGGPATAAEFRATTGLCFDKIGNLYIADEQSDNIRKVNTSGIIYTIAGTTAGFSGDGGPAVNAQLTSPLGIVLDNIGNLYIAASYNYRIRKINTSGIISTIAGIGTGSGPNVCYGGCNALIMQLNAPTGIAADAYGNVYLSAIVDDVVHKITPDGKLYTIAGTVNEGFSGDGGPATNAQLHSPTMICLDNKGNLLIADKGNARIRKVWLDGTVHTPPAPIINNGALLVSPNPVTQKSFSCTVQTNTNEQASLVITDVLGKVVSTATCTTNIVKDISFPMPSGIYFISATTTSGRKMSAKIVVE